MRLLRVRFTVRQLMLAVLAAALGLAIAPAGYPYLAALTPVALGFALLAPSSLVGPALLVLACSVFLEIILGYPVPLWVYMPVAIVLEGALWPRPCPPDQARPSTYKKAAAVGALIAGLYLIPWTPRKPFVRALESVRSGMTVADVGRVMAGYLEGTGSGWTITGDAVHEAVLGGPVFFRHSDDPDFNADIGTVYFANGRVTRVGFSPD